MDQNNNQQTSETEQSYDPNRLLNFMLEKFNLKTDAALARMLEVGPPVISKIRHRKVPLGASLLIRMNDISGIDTKELRRIMGDRRERYRMSETQGRPAPKQKDYTPDAAHAVAA